MKTKPEFNKPRLSGVKNSNDMAALTGLDAMKLTIDAAKPVAEKIGVPGNDLISSIVSGDAISLPESTAQADAPVQSDDDVIKTLAALSKQKYEKVRLEKAKALGFRPTVLDELVQSARCNESEADKSLFVEVEPYPDPIDPAQLLDEISDTIRRFIVLDTEQACAAALWVALTWFIDVVEYAPLAIINAPEKSCGKTLLLTVLGRMAYRPLPAANASPSALFRAVDLWKPTILIDEADTFFRDNFELHGMVNAGYQRGGSVLRSEPVGDTFEPRSFPVFSAKALAGIALEKHLPDTTMSRGIVFNLRRKLPHESVSRLRHAERDLFTGISEKLARFALDYSQQVGAARPALPDALSDRNQDNWEGLLAIASCAGDEWLVRATAAALKLSGAGEKTASTSNELLADIQHIFESKELDKISAADLIAALCEDEEKPWASCNHGKPLSFRQLATQLKRYDGLSSKNIRCGYDGIKKGFELAQFEDVFARYLIRPPENSLFAATPLQTTKHAGLGVAEDALHSGKDSQSATLKPSNGGVCSGVADKTPILGSIEASRTNASHLKI